MKRIVGISCLVGITLVFGAVILFTPSPSPEAAAPCLECPLVPLPDECPACYEWVPQTCRQCGHCARIKGCKV